MKTADFDFELPPELIAQHPVAERTESRMMVLHRRQGRLEHRHFRDLPEYLRAGDLLVLNNTRVLPARLFGRREPSGGKVELLLIEEQAPGVWDALCRMSRRTKPGMVFRLGGDRIRAEVRTVGEKGRVTLELQSEQSLAEVLEQEGFPPLPPYIRREAGVASADDRERYQTVYAKVPGAVAAPTAGLHFTQEMLARLGRQGVDHAMVTLHVGLGTFRPVEAEDVEAHRMEPERYSIPAETAAAVNRVRAAGGRIIGVGSTAVRTLETGADETGRMAAGAGRTALFVYPPYRFRVTDVMLTNFHLPRSSLLLLVSALAGRELIRHAYDEAVKEKYRFYSYGDCMLIL